MPELPDVELFNRYLRRTALHKKIRNISIPDKDLLENVSSQKLSRALKGKKLTDTYRHGKYLFVKAGDNWLALHFGMTGFLKYYKNEKEKPEHIKLLLNFSNNYSLAYDCMRKLGLISLTGDVKKYLDKKEVGLDPLADDLDFEKFDKLLKDNRGSLKSFFMNQKHIAGLGNIYVDELLFHSHLHPKSDLNKVDNQISRKLFRNMNKIIEKAIDVDVERKEFPRTYLIRHREDGVDCPRCEGKIKQIKISGRSTYFCNKHQKKI